MTDEGNGRPSRSLAGESVHDEHLRELEAVGGAVLLNMEWSALRASIHKYRPEDAYEILERFTDDKVAIRRYWPVTTFASSQYWFWTSFLGPNRQPLPPSQMLRKFASVASHARNLARALTEIQEAHIGRLDEGAHHAEALWWLLAQGIAGYPTTEILDDGPHIVEIESAYRNFIKSLVDLEVMAIEAPKKAEPEYLKQTVSPALRGLPRLIEISSAIWRDIRGEEPKAYRYETENSEGSEFVQFVQAIARMQKITDEPQDIHVPSVDQVIRALANFQGNRL